MPWVAKLDADSSTSQKPDRLSNPKISSEDSLDSARSIKGPSSSWRACSGSALNAIAARWSSTLSGRSPANMGCGMFPWTRRLSYVSTTYTEARVVSQAGKVNFVLPTPMQRTDPIHILFDFPRAGSSPGICKPAGIHPVSRVVVGYWAILESTIKS